MNETFFKNLEKIERKIFRTIHTSKTLEQLNCAEKFTELAFIKLEKQIHGTNYMRKRQYLHIFSVIFFSLGVINEKRLNIKYNRR